MKHYAAAVRRLSVPRRWMIATLLAAVGLANIAQPFPAIAPLQHIPSVVLSLAAPLLLERFPLSNRSLAALLAFFLLHTLAGRYTYSNVPYDIWSEALSGHRISDLLGMKRNNFDRLVHLCFGLLWIGPVAEILRRHGGFSRRAGVWTAFLFVGAVSAAYEVFEWMLTIVAAPELSEGYNGQQGDVWDSQKDMAIAIFGGIIASWWELRVLRAEARRNAGAPDRG